MGHRVCIESVMPFVCLDVREHQKRLKPKEATTSTHKFVESFFKAQWMHTRCHAHSIDTTQKAALHWQAARRIILGWAALFITHAHDKYTHTNSHTNVIFTHTKHRHAHERTHLFTDRGGFWVIQSIRLPFHQSDQPMGKDRTMINVRKRCRLLKGTSCAW